MSVFGDNLRSAIERSGMTKVELAKQLNTTPTTIYRWEKGINEASDEIKIKLAAVLNTTVAYLMGETSDPNPLSEANVRKDSIRSFDNLIEIPVLDPTAIACAGVGNGGMTGIYINAQKTVFLPSNLVGTISVDVDKKPFAILVEGDSMEGAGIPDRSTVVVNPAESVYDGDVALVCFGLQNEWAIKWVYFNKKDESIEIRSAAPQYKPMLFTKEEIELGLFNIVGKVTLYTGTPRKGI
ncbi:LexA family transcriptional regulator [Aminobacterium sp. MB27-C1]|uniref:LexA family protein n=1 Tax=Aminobacterium sp. MB27-C1 TaxID=3070661 RepID=UPI0027DC6B49|nr:LexA family transcriptional regulator [Aminobacterium sp. MB27-C1]WMI72124.1 LexA family transcriptional regulator [Aminobacterium sp. MB27-C1]